MKLNILEDEKDSLTIEFVDADRGIADLIKDKLLENKDVDFVSVVKEHPEAGKPRLVVRSSKNAKSLVIKAMEEVEEEIKEMEKMLPKK